MPTWEQLPWEAKAFHVIDCYYRGKAAAAGEAAIKELNKAVYSYQHFTEVSVPKLKKEIARFLEEDERIKKKYNV